MDNKRFDDIAKSIASLASRRTVVKGMVGGALAGVVGLRGADAAKKRAQGQTCRNTPECAEGLACVIGSDGRRRCLSCGEATVCGSVCCTTYCSEDLVCADSVTDPVCYENCLENYCYSSNFNYTFNQTGNCEAFCAYDICSFPV